jgi:hypothetical protein
MATPLADFTRELRNTESQYRRMDSGTLTGRNADASADSLSWKLRRLRDLARTDAVCDALDANPKLAARWNRIERRAAGL